MKADFSPVLIDLDGTEALDQSFDKEKRQPKLVPLTAALAVMRALNIAEAPEGEKMQRYEIMKKIRANAKEVNLVEGEPELVRTAVQKLWPAFIYGQVCEILKLK